MVDDEPEPTDEEEETEAPIRIGAVGAVNGLVRAQSSWWGVANNSHLDQPFITTIASHQMIEEEWQVILLDENGIYTWT